MGTAFLEIIRDVLHNDRDLVMKAAEEGGGLTARLFGSTDMHLLRNCPCPVWLMRSVKPGHLRKILAAVDLDPPGGKAAEDTLNRQILEMAISLALSEFAELHIVHVWHAYGESYLRHGFVRQPKVDVEAYVEDMRLRHQRWLAEVVDGFVHNVGEETVGYLKPQLHMVQGFPEKVIPALAKEDAMDLIIMGTVARTGIPGFLMGNTAETILNRIECSVLAIKPAGFVTPVTLED